ncbi:hypothetical protein [Actinopolyspora halophila]|uniref:hypothetical protein n=1 Tax=Actinopolyspora halophila TaxID=1850 RepID=UPI0003814835|nr:hypothetical protein [Actinopolyspora halophila]
MGKGARNRSRQRTTTAVASAAPAGPFFHGGVPGKGPGDVLWPAQRLGFQFQFHTVGATYDPSWVYITTDADVATAYASRYVDFLSNREGYGDVYEVEPVETPQLDPDYHVFPEVFLRCRTARITRVVTTGVWLSRTEQNYLERHYSAWGDPAYPVFDENGHILPSEEMRANGVTREWTTLLLPWLGEHEVDTEGRLIIVANSPTPWATMLASIPVLDRDCQIEQHPRQRSGLRCAVCGHQPAHRDAAALHQLGEHPMRMLTRIYGWQIPPVPPLVEAARARSPHRWAWLD